MPSFFYAKILYNYSHTDYTKPVGVFFVCTALTLECNGHFFGRTLDLEYSYDEKIIILPRNFEFKFNDFRSLNGHFAIIGMATVKNGIPLIYDATNEYGLSVAGLNFPGNAYYNQKTSNRPNVAPFEIIPLILSTCKSTNEAVSLIKEINIADINFDEMLPSSPLHWIVADNDNCVSVEPEKEGLKIHKNPVGVLTNNPPFTYHMMNLNNYISVSSGIPDNRFSPAIDLIRYSRGMGGIGLPGDNSSCSRFIRTVFLKYNALPENNDGVGLFFRIMSGIEQTKGTVRLDDKKNVMSLYTSCCDTDKCIYYYKTYQGGINAINMFKEDLDSDKLIIFELKKDMHITMQN